MSFKKWTALAMVIALLLTGVVGCKSADSGEEAGAMVDEYVESDPSDVSKVPQDAPEKVENPEGVTVDEPEEEPEEEPADPPEEAPEQPQEQPTEEPEEEAPAAPPQEEEPEESEVTYKQENLLKIVDYNVRCANDGDGKTVDERAPRLKKLIDELDPDMMGFQEVTTKWRGILDGYFTGKYDYVYKERKSGDECTPIFWKRDKFEKLDEGHFWLSETPDQESKGWDADYYRICTWVKLKVKATGTEFLYFNSHWDGSEACHLGSATLTLSRARKEGAFEDYAMFLTADFNMKPWSKGYNALVESGDLLDVNYELDDDQTPTTNGYNESSGGRIIDMCFYSPSKSVPVSYRVLNEKIDGGYISDHRGLLVEVALL